MSRPRIIRSDQHRRRQKGRAERRRGSQLQRRRRLIQLARLRGHLESGGSCLARELYDQIDIDDVKKVELKDAADHNCKDGGGSFNWPDCEGTLNLAVHVSPANYTIRSTSTTSKRSS